MTPKGKMLRRIGCFCLVLLMCFSLAACRGNQGQNESTVDPGAPDVTYTISVKSEGGVAMPNIEIYIFENDKLQDLVAVTATDAEGKAVFTAKEGGSYAAVLTTVPSGYTAEEFYAVTGTETQIVLNMELVDGDLTTAVYKLGDVMQDFTFTDCNGNSYKLSELLESKKAVVLNFWKIDGVDSKVELPCLQKAYGEYADSVAVLCMNPVDTDNAAIAAYAKELGVTLPIGTCEAEWVKAMQILGFPTTVVIDRFGTVAMSHGQPVKKTHVFTDVFAYFTADGYVQKTVGSIDELIVTEDDPNEVENPDEIFGGRMEFDLTLDPGQLHYVRIPNVDNVWLQVNSNDVYVEYGGKKFQPSGGSVGLLVSAPSTFEPALVGFCNQGEERVTVHITMSNLPGSYDNPYTLKVGQFTASVSAGNNQGVYFTYTATEDGYFSLQCLSVSPNCGYDISIMNMSTSVMKDIESDGETDAQGNTVLRAPAKKGQTLQIVIGSLPDDNNKYPAAKFQMLAGFTAGEVADIEKEEVIAYALTVTDENRKPLAGVNVGFTPDNPTDTNTGAKWVTDENGVVSGYLPKDGYTVSAVVPSGYRGTTTQIHLSPENPMGALKFETYVIVMENYSVHVSDPEGKPVENALVVIGSASGYTDSYGVFTANLEKGEYTAVIQKSGYALTEQAFTKGSTVLNVKLELDSGDVQDGIDYTVYVTDYAGTPVTGVTVSLYRYGTLAGMEQVDARGVAKLHMKAGTYTVGLTSVNGIKLKFEEITLTAAESSGTVKVAVSGNVGNHTADFWGSYYTISTGSTWVDMTDMVNSTATSSVECLAEYQGWAFVFMPKNPGIYRFTVSDGALLAYFGNLVFQNMNRDTSSEEHYFDVTVRDGNVESDNGYLVAVKSTSGKNDAIITVTKVGDPEPPLPSVAYENKVAPTAFKLNQSGTRTYMDLTGTAQPERHSDGFYYLNGKQVYINIGKSAPYITIAEMVGLEYNETTEQWDQTSMATGLKGYVFEDGVAVAVEQYNDAIKEYIRKCDVSNGLYPLTDDLVHMLQKAAAYKGWGDPEDPDYLFDTKVVNPELAWLFACCYFA